MAFKTSFPWLVSGAAATAGLVWLSRLLKRKPVEREEWDSAPSEAKTEPLPKPALTFPDDLEEEAVAAADARRDIGEEPLNLATAEDLEEVDPLESPDTIHTQDLEVQPDEPYDALDAEDLGTEWLFRATEAGPPERPMTPEQLAAALEAARNKP